MDALSMSKGVGWPTKSWSISSFVMRVFADTVHSQSTVSPSTPPGTPSSDTEGMVFDIPSDASERRSAARCPAPTHLV